MKRLGGMPAFVSNGWAAKDYTHINYAGGKRIGNALCDAICQRVYRLLTEREEQARIEAERKAEQQRQRELEAKELLDSQIDAVAPIIDSLGWNNEASNTNNEE
jgi:hypothetical protein